MICVESHPILGIMFDVQAASPQRFPIRVGILRIGDPVLIEREAFLRLRTGEERRCRTAAPIFRELFLGVRGRCDLLLDETVHEQLIAIGRQLGIAFLRAIQLVGVRVLRNRAEVQIVDELLVLRLAHALFVHAGNRIESAVCGRFGVGPPTVHDARAEIHPGLFIIDAGYFPLIGDRTVDDVPLRVAHRNLRAVGFLADVVVAFQHPLRVCLQR